MAQLKIQMNLYTFTLRRKVGCDSVGPILCTPLPRMLLSLDYCLLAQTLTYFYVVGHCLLASMVKTVIRFLLVVTVIFTGICNSIAYYTHLFH